LYWIDLVPDGKTMLYSSNASGITHLYVSLTKPGSRPIQITSGNEPIIAGWFSPGGNRILYPQDESGNELDHLFVTSLDGTKTERITKQPCRTFDVSWHPNGREIVRVYSGRESCGIEVIDVETKESLVLKEQEAPFFTATYSHDGGWIACTEYGGGKDPKSTQVSVVSRNDPADMINYKLNDGSKEEYPSWAPDDQRLAFLSDARGKPEVVIQDFKSDDHFFLSLEEGEEVLESLGGLPVSWASTGNSVYYIVSKHGRTGVYEHPLSGEKIALPFPAGTVSMQRISKDGKFLVALHSSMSSPHCIYRCAAGSKTVTPLTSRTGKEDFSKLAKPTSVWYESFDGLKIHSWYLSAVKGKPLHPAVTVVHGGPWSQYGDAWSPYLQSISQSGFALLVPNFRGSTGYGAEFRNMDVSDLGGGDLEDVVAGAKWLAGQQDIDKSKIAIMGGSYGGYMTLIALTKKPEVFAAGVAFVPITDFSEVYELSDASYRRFWEELFGGFPDQKRDAYRNSSPINYVSQIKAPVLISCGRNDSRCPIQPVEKFVEKLKEMKHPHEFRVTEDEGHVFMFSVESFKRQVTTGIEYLKRTFDMR